MVPRLAMDFVWQLKMTLPISERIVLQTSKCPLLAAECKGVHAFISPGFLCLKFLIINRQTLKRPFNAAKCRGVNPLVEVGFFSFMVEMRYLQIFK